MFFPPSWKWVQLATTVSDDLMVGNILCLLEWQTLQQMEQQTNNIPCPQCEHSNINPKESLTNGERLGQFMLPSRPSPARWFGMSEVWGRPRFCALSWVL